MRVSPVIPVGKGWEIREIQLRDSSPLALIKFSKAGEGRGEVAYARIDLSKRMLIDAAPLRVGTRQLEELASEIATRVSRYRVRGRAVAASGPR